ncbi:NmrA domain-containing protein [Mycena chlorophos]|uniref:NmrA domain-containing protein n=1 Tax=Mycena chlorophos TaxID=658473 RepID=A0A8H6TS76_MYCCL|nr:NmrA domain-containing protein [Mycena chlorophos]
MKQTVLLLGATGRTGASILEALLVEPESFAVSALVRPESASRDDVLALAARGVGLQVVDIEGPLEPVVEALKGFDVVISTIDFTAQLAQLQLATAAKQAGVKRFVPCAFITVAPPGGVMHIRDEKEAVYQHIFKLYLPYTIIDVGFWHQISFPRVPSGRADYALLHPGGSELHADGKAKNLLTDLRDVGRYVARIIKDDRTLNKYVVTYSDSLSEEEIYSLTEEAFNEKIERKYISADEIVSARAKDTEESIANPNDMMPFVKRVGGDYQYSKYVRGDNTAEYAKYLGYLDTNELYPDFKPIKFRDFLVELLQQKVPTISGKLPQMKAKK